MEKIGTIYKIENSLTGMIYIGFDSKYPSRITAHKNNALRGMNSELYNDIRNNGWDNFSHEIIYQCNDLDYCLTVMEPFYIKLFDSFNFGYNRTLGGEGSLGSPRPKDKLWRKNHSQLMKENNPMSGYVYTDERKKHHSHKMKEYYKHNPDKKPIGIKNGMFGKTHSDEWKKNHSSKIKEHYKNGTFKRMDDIPCSYCGKEIWPANLKRHENICLKNISPRIKEILKICI